MTLGDSITAGFAIMGRDVPTQDLLNEYRGLSGFIGGDPNALTLGTYFQYYNPSVFGMSLGQHFVELPGWEYYPSLDVLNSAQSGAASYNFEFEINYLLEQLKSNPNISLANDWKFVNVLVGANDACPLCWQADRPTVEDAAESFGQNMAQVFDTLYTKIPRLFVNVLPMFNVSPVYNLGLNLTYCFEFHDIIPFECPCAFDSDPQNREYLDSVLQAYDAQLYKLADYYKAKNYSDFQVVIQPYTQYLVIPSADLLSTLDCFHPNLLAHQQLSLATWDSLLLPAALKPLNYVVGNITVTCPTEDTLLYVW